MEYVKIIRRDGRYDKIPVYNIEDFPYDKIDKKAFNVNRKSTICSQYSQTFATFDIESTTITSGDRPFGFMYHWQMCVDGYVVIGRYWEDWLAFLDRICEILSISPVRHLVIYVHNLGYEYQFIYDFLNEHFGGYKVFASQERKPIHVTTTNGIEFRCSYKLSNMSLAKATENEKGVVHIKASGDLDYKKLFLPSSKLTMKEKGYCVSDVVSLYEYIECKMLNEHDNLETIPMTSTGYVRRDCRRSCRKSMTYRTIFLKTQISPEAFELLLEASRGGDTHANRNLAGKILHEVDSYDVQSSYPAQMLLQRYPMTSFHPYGEVETMAELRSLLNTRACLFRVAFTHLELKEGIAMPYIPTAKSRHVTNAIYDNGRIISADTLEITITDIDFDLIERQYTWDTIYVSDMYTAQYDYLPKELTSVIMDYFTQKTQLKARKEKLEKGDELDNIEYLYGKSKNRLNGIFGMCFTNPIHELITVNESGDWETEEAPKDHDEYMRYLEKHLNKFYKSRNSFLSFAWGVWVTCHARRWLADLVTATGGNYAADPDNTAQCVYCDTDSSKAVGVDQAKVDALNAKIIDLAEARGAYADADGKRYYMGVYEHENKEPISEFITLGAKKYCYTDEKGLHVTVSGVNKKEAPTELKDIHNFRAGFIFKKAGGSTLYYNKDVIHQITIKGETFTTASNIGMIDSTYELGLTDEYFNLIGYNILEELDAS